MKIATFNIQNLFHRDKSLIKKPIGKNLMDWIQELDSLMRKPSNTLSEQDRIRELSFLIGFEKFSPKPYAVLRKKAGFLYMKGLHHSSDSKASDLTNWNGWIALQTMPINPLATDNKALVLAAVNADVLLLQEIEDRASLEEFNRQVLPKFNCKPYVQSFVIQSEESIGKENAILLREGYTLASVKTYDIGNLSVQNTLLQYEVTTPTLQTMWILSTSLVGAQKEDSAAHRLRKQQSQNIVTIYQNLIEECKSNVIITGTFNAPSYCDSLSPLFQNTDLKDITKHLSFEVDCDKGKDAKYYSLGAYRMGVNIKQKDYMLLSPSLYNAMIDSGLNRKAVWPKKRPQWSIYKTVTSESNAASEHPVIWGVIEI